VSLEGEAPDSMDHREGDEPAGEDEELEVYAVEAVVGVMYKSTEP